MKIRHQLIYIERVQRRVTIELDMPPDVEVKEIYAAAREVIKAKARERDNDPWLQPDLQFISIHQLGEVPDEDTPTEHQPSKQVDANSERSTNVQPSSD